MWNSQRSCEQCSTIAISSAKHTHQHTHEQIVASATKPTRASFCCIVREFACVCVWLPSGHAVAEKIRKLSPAQAPFRTSYNVYMYTFHLATAYVLVASASCAVLAALRACASLLWLTPVNSRMHPSLPIGSSPLFTFVSLAIGLLCSPFTLCKHSLGFRV